MAIQWCKVRLTNTRDGRIFYEGVMPCSSAADWLTRKHVRLEYI